MKETLERYREELLTPEEFAKQLEESEEAEEVVPEVDNFKLDVRKSKAARFLFRKKVLPKDPNFDG